MSECRAMQERMPDVAGGATSWTVAESAHLAECPECAREWRVVRAGAALQGDATIDADRVAQLVVARLRSEPIDQSPIHRIPWRGGVAVLLAAAAAVVLFVSAPQLRRPDVGAAGGTAALAVLPELQALDEGQLEIVLKSLGPAAADATPGTLPHLDDLTDSELEQLLRSEGGE